jgi:uncharacterized protein YkwD
MSKSLLTLHNQYRSEYKPFSFWHKTKPLELLTIDNKLMNYAIDHCVWMKENKQLKHSKISNIMKLGFSVVAENIAWGQRTTEDVMKVWMNSRGHRNNILNSKFTKIGYASVQEENNGLYYWCVVFGK